VSGHVVKQRLKLAAISPRLMQAYRDGDLNLEQLMAFTITDDHVRQEAVFDGSACIQQAWSIRRELMRAAVPAHDRRAKFVGAEAYEAAGGLIVRDLFEDDGGGYFENPALLEQLVLEKLEIIAANVKAHQGWRWVQPSIDYPHAHGMRRCYPQQVELCEADAARLTEASEEYNRLAGEHEAYDELPEDVAFQLGALENEIAELIQKRNAYSPEDIARSGVFVVLGHDGEPRIERGLIRPEDKQPGPEGDGGGDDVAASASGDCGGGSVSADKPLPDSLIRDLTAHRTLGLRLTLGEQPDMALIALTHALVAQTFYHRDASCLEIRLRSEPLGGHAPGIDDTKAGQAMAERHESWARQLPNEVDELWAFIVGWDQDSRSMLLAHCVALSVNGIKLANTGKIIAKHGDDLAQAVGLDMTRHWQPTAEGYFSRINKAQIGEAVTEAVSVEAAARVAALKKPDMAAAAEKLVAGSGWLPELLRTPTATVAEAESEADAMRIAAE
jgi:ParB family chromosome partitioning protein